MCHRVRFISNWWQIIKLVLYFIPSKFISVAYSRIYSLWYTSLSILQMYRVIYLLIQPKSWYKTVLSAQNNFFMLFLCGQLFPRPWTPGSHWNILHSHSCVFSECHINRIIVFIVFWSGIFKLAKCIWKLSMLLHASIVLLFVFVLFVFSFIT